MPDFNALKDLLLDRRVLPSIIQAGGGILSGIGDNKQQNADRELQQRLAIANFLQGQEAREQGAAFDREQFDRQGAGAALAALGGPFEMSNALNSLKNKRDILGTARNVSIDVPEDIRASMGTVSGGLRIPDGGLDLSALSDAALSENARSYLSNVAQLNPRSRGADLGTMGLGTAGSVASEDVEAQRLKFLAEQGDTRARADERSSGREAEIMRYLSGGGPQIGGAQGAPPDGYEYDKKTGQLKKKGGLLGKIGSVLKVAAPIAASFIPGVGPLAAMGISAAANTAGTKMQGGSWGDAAKSGAMGAATGALAAKSPFKIPRGRLTGNPGTIVPMSPYMSPNFDPFRAVLMDEPMPGALASNRPFGNVRF